MVPRQFFKKLWSIVHFQYYVSYRCIIHCCLVAKSSLTLCDPMDCSMPGSLVLCYLLEFAQIHVHLSRWCYLTISSSAVPFFCLQFFPEPVEGSVQSLSHVWLFATPWTAARQASLSITNSRSSLKLTYIESVMPSSHLILCRPLLLLPPIPPSIRVFSSESTLHMRWPKYWSFSFSIQCTI